MTRRGSGVRVPYGPPGRILVTAVVGPPAAVGESPERGAPGDLGEVIDAWSAAGCPSVAHGRDCSGLRALVQRDRRTITTGIPSSRTASADCVPGTLPKPCSRCRRRRRTSSTTRSRAPAPPAPPPRLASGPRGAVLRRPVCAGHEHRLLPADVGQVTQRGWPASPTPRTPAPPAHRAARLSLPSHRSRSRRVRGDLARYTE
jgi:hypothetical protein